MSQAYGILVGSIVLLLFTMTGCGVVPDSATTDLGIMSFNIRNGKANDGDNSPDVVGLQEAFRFQFDQLAEDLPRYAEIGEGRAGGAKDEYSAILFRADRFDVIDSGTFWLSDTPEKVSKTWGHYHYRVCTWAHLRDRSTGQAFYVYNTHFDHASQPARLKSAKLISQRIAERGTKDPVILTGDLNADEKNHAVQYLKGMPYEAPLDGPAIEEMPPVRLVDTFRVLHPDAKQVGTGNGRYTGKRDGAKIDYVLVGPGIETLTAAIDQEPRNGRYPSDHYPVTATVRLKPAND